MSPIFRVKPTRAKVIFRPDSKRSKLGKETPEQTPWGNMTHEKSWRMSQSDPSGITPEGVSNLQTAPAWNHDRPTVPILFKSLPPIRDDLVTETSESQDETVQECLPHLAGTAHPNKTVDDFTPHGVPRLERDDHIDFLRKAIQNARFIAYDAARPWVVYWALTGLCLLGVDVEPYREQYGP